MGPVFARSARFMGVAWLLLAVGCGGSGGQDGGASAPPAPSGLRIQQGSEFEVLEITWVPPAAPVDGFEGQARAGGGAWQDFGQAISPTAIGVVVRMSTSVPEVVTLGFRFRALRGGVAGEWSPEASFQRGPRWPEAATTGVEPAGIRVGWSNASTQATDVRVYRLESSTSTREFLLAEVPATVTSFTDPGPFAPATPVGYALASVAGAVESTHVFVHSAGYPVVPVTDVTATNEAGGIRLRWRRPPLLGQSFQVHRKEGLAFGYFSSPLLPAPVDADEFLDVPPRAGGFGYAIETWIGGATASAWAQVPGFGAPAGPPPLTPSLRTLPDAVGAARDSAGRLAFAVGGPVMAGSTPLQVSFAGAGAPADHFVGNGMDWAAPGVVFDPDDRPHALFLGVPDATGDLPLVHAWYDGVAWQEEVVARRNFTSHTIRLAVDATGGLHAVWSALGPPAIAEYARRGLSGWTIEDLGPAVTMPVSMVSVAADGGGAPAVLLRDPALPRLLHRDAGGGAWSVDSPPDRILALAPRETGWGVASIEVVPDANGARVALLVQPWTAAGPGVEEVAFRWSSPEPIAAIGLAAREVPQRQVAWAASSIDRLALAVRTGGAWGEQVVYEGCGFVLPRIDALGKVAVLCETTERPFPSLGNRYWVDLVEP